MTRRTCLQSFAALLAASVPWAPFRPRAAARTIGAPPTDTGPIFDYRAHPLPGTIGAAQAGGFQCFDAITGDPVPKVFFFNTNNSLVGRYRCDENGTLFLYTPDGRGLDDPDVIWETRRLRLVPIP